ncbi:hypothetical protein [Streptomyces flavidovirens]
MAAKITERNLLTTMSSPSPKAPKIPDPSPLMRHVKTLVAAAATAETYALVVTGQADAKRASTQASVSKELHDQQQELKRLGNEYLDKRTQQVNDLVAWLGRTAQAAYDNPPDWGGAAQDAGDAMQRAGKLKEDLAAYVADVKKGATPFLARLDSQITGLEGKGISQIQHQIDTLHSEISRDIAKMTARSRKPSADLQDKIDKIVTALKDAVPAKEDGKKTPAKKGKATTASGAYLQESEEDLGEEQAPKSGKEPGGTSGEKPQQGEDDQETAEEIYARIERNIKKLGDLNRLAAKADVTLTTAIGLRAETNSFVWASESLTKPMEQFCARWKDMSTQLAELAGKPQGEQKSPATRTNPWKEFHEALKNLSRDRN